MERDMKEQQNIEQREKNQMGRDKMRQKETENNGKRQTDIETDVIEIVRDT